MDNIAEGTYYPWYYTSGLTWRIWKPLYIIATTTMTSSRDRDPIDPRGGPGARAGAGRWGGPGGPGGVLPPYHSIESMQARPTHVPSMVCPP